MINQQLSSERIVVEPWEVGGELLDILSRGLYSNASAAVREYIQNGVDAGASNILVTVSGPRMTVRDDGSGMDWQTLREARRFGVSSKSPKSHVGYRGIGMYSAFGMCETLHIITRKAGMENQLALRLHFGPMRRILEQDRISEQREGVALADLLYAHTEFSEEPYTGDTQNDHFTIVRLDGIGREYRSQLNDAGSLSSYLLDNLPVASPEEGYGGAVNNWLRDHVGLNPVNIVLRIGREPEFSVQPYVAENVRPPDYHWIEDEVGRRLAFIWYALSNDGKQIPSFGGKDGGAGVSGYLLRMKGFTLGDRTSLKHLWPPVGGQTLYHHYTGEIHVLGDADVYPNAARDDLEPGLSKQLLHKQIGDYFEILNGHAQITQDLLRLKRRTQGLRETVQEQIRRQGSDDSDQFEMYREGKNTLETLDKIERDLQRLQRRRRVRPAEPQLERIAQLMGEVTELRGKTEEVVDKASQQAETQRRPVTTDSTERPPAVPPQVVLLEAALHALIDNHEKSPDIRFEEALARIGNAARRRSVTQAVNVLDELRAGDAPVSDAVEAVRKQLRTIIGWSQVGPVSLEEALAESGVPTSTPREQMFVEAIDRGLLEGLGGRGERYEAVLKSISESVSEYAELQ